MAIVMTVAHFEGERVQVSSRAYAESRYGDDGPANGPDAELVVGDGSGSVSSRTDYDDGTLDDGTWTGWTRFRVDANPGGGAAGVSLYDPAATNADLIYTGAAYGEVTDVAFAAFAGVAGATAEFDDVEVLFLKAGQVVDQFSAASLPQARAADDGTSQEQLYDVATNANADAAIVSARVTYTAPPGTYPAPDDLFGSVFFGAYPPAQGATGTPNPTPEPINPGSGGDNPS